MSDSLLKSITPFELIIGLVGGLGTDFTTAVTELKKHFDSSDCEFEELRLTSLLHLPEPKDFLSDLRNKIKKIDDLREHIGKGVMASVAVNKIFKNRKSNKPSRKVYVINSLKHPMEYDVLRHI